MPWLPTLIDSEILSVHAALLPVGAKGKVLMVGGDEHNGAQGGTDTTPALPANVDRTALFDVDTRDVDRIGSPTTDVFCSGHAFLGDGRLLIAGGTESWGEEAGGDPEGPGGGHDHDHGNFGGHRACWVYNYLQNAWTRVADLQFEVGPGKGGGRWYPSLVTLPSGDVVAFGGHPSRLSNNWHENDIPERYSRVANAWSWYPNAIHFEHSNYPGNWYPRITLVRGGWIFFITRHGGSCRFFDPATGSLVGPVVGSAGGMYDEGWNYSVILLPLVPEDGYRARVMAVNDLQPRMIELNLDSGAPTPVWTNAGARQAPAEGKRRRYSCPVYLPTGQVLVSGGINGGDDDDAVKEIEIYTPDVNWTTRAYGGGPGTWQTVVENPPAQVARNYHTVALLLPDGSVFTSSSSKDGNSGPPDTAAQKNIEIYFPSYFSAAGRPLLLNAPRSLSYAHTQFVAQTGSVAQAASIRKVALVRCGSVTHAADFDQRYVALAFTHQAGTANLQVAYPNDPSVLPPGYYMLWVVAEGDLPCQTARFVRVAHQTCYLYTDRSTFSIHEVDAILATVPGTPPARFEFAVSAVFDGFLQDELAGGTPAATLHFDSPSGAAPTGMSLDYRGMSLENPALGADIPQRVTYRYDVVFASSADFASFTETRLVHVRVEYRGHVCTQALRLHKQPNPYMLDGQVPWLSTDLRVFQVRAGENWKGIATPGNDPLAFIGAVVSHFRGRPNDAAHPFLTVSTDQTQSRLELSSEVDGTRVYNFAVAKVRYMAQTVPANDVKVFFRMFKTAASNLAYNQNVEYRRTGTGAAAMPLLGRNGSEIVSIPFFGVARVNTAALSMASQPVDTLNRASLTASAPNEFAGYYGCWLDINQTGPGSEHFPLNPTSDGPYPMGRLPIQQLVRGLHQCLVAEVFFEPDPMNPAPPTQPAPLIEWQSTPGTSDKLSQRNLAIVESDNPGGPETHTIQHTFEIRPSRASVVDTIEGGAHAQAMVHALKARPRGRPDELVVHWKNLPPGTGISLYLPGVDADEILGLAALTRTTPVAFEKEDEHTLRLHPGDITYVPVPGGRTENIVGLVSVRLPDTVVKGQLFSLVVQQVDGVDDRVIGSWQLTIPVSTADAILPTAVRQLSVLRYIAEAIPPWDRWYPVFARYLEHQAERVRGLGGDPDRVEPSPRGTGQAEKTRCDPWWLWGLSLLVAVLLVAVAVLPAALAAPVLAAGIVAVLGFLWWLRTRCRSCACRIVQHLLLGTATAGFVLALLVLAGWYGGALLPVFCLAAILSLVLAAVLVLRGCGGECEGDETDRKPPVPGRP